MTKINKKTALKRLLSGKAVTLCPSKFYPECLFGVGVTVAAIESKDEFTKMVHAFHYYNCNNQTGKKVNYWI